MLRFYRNINWWSATPSMRDPVLTNTTPISQLGFTFYMNPSSSHNLCVQEKAPFCEHKSQNTYGGHENREPRAGRMSMCTLRAAPQQTPFPSYRNAFARPVHPVGGGTAGFPSIASLQGLCTLRMEARQAFLLSHLCKACTP